VSLQKKEKGKTFRKARTAKNPSTAATEAGKVGLNIIQDHDLSRVNT